MSKIFIIDYQRLVNWLVPGALRKPVTLAWLRVMMSQVVLLYQAFMRNRNANLYTLGITPQVCYLEKMLNDRFDNTARGIWIGDPQRSSALYLYRDDELKPEWLYTDAENKPLVAYSDEEAGLRNVDFIVHLPAGLVANINEMKALLDMYKLAGKTYKIETH